jgi:hypothetical protein
MARQYEQVFQLVTSCVTDADVTPEVVEGYYNYEGD